MLTDEQKRRYARHIMLDDFGEAGQEKLLNSSALVVGAGGLGSAALTYLAAAGVGRLGIVDHDHVELSNLQRQIIHEQGDIGRLKVESAADRLSELNPECHVDLYPQRIRQENANAILSRYDIILDGTDNFESRMLIAETSERLKVPLVHAAVTGFKGYITIFAPHQGTITYHDFMPEAPNEPNNCNEVGVLGPMAGIMGSLQALETIKCLLGKETALLGKLLSVDCLNNQFRIAQL